MSLSHNTGKLTAAVATAIPAGATSYINETFAIDKPITSNEMLPRQGKALVPAHFSYAHHNPEFTPVYSPPTKLPMNYGTYIYNIVDGFQ